MQGIWWTKMSIKQRKEMLLQQLDLSGLEGWSVANCASAHALLTEYHDIFSLEPGELGYTNLVKHDIKVVQNKLFKERFQRIPCPMLEEVRAHMKEMLEMGMIYPNQSSWCNAVMLVRKKDGGLHFCRYFSCLDLKVSFCQIAMDEASKQHMAFMVGNLGFFKCECMPFGLCNAPVTF